jgi:1,2-beta-oligoglucan phosphorylase
MNSRPVAPSSSRPLTSRSAREFDLIELRSTSGLTAQLLPTGAMFALRHGATLINQLLPGPAEDGLLRVMLRWRDEARWRWAPLVGPTTRFGADEHGATWDTELAGGLRCRTTLQVHPHEAVWLWRTEIENTGSVAREVQVLLAQDLGLADEGAVRNNEAYTSHYLDLLPYEDAALRWIIFARQNQTMSGGRRPWLALACTSGALAYATDGTQVFGGDHRLTSVLQAGADGLPSHRLQGEFAMAALESSPREIGSGGRTEIGFVAAYQADHPEASGARDVQRVQAALSLRWHRAALNRPSLAATAMPPGLFTTAPWVHGEQPSPEVLAAWFPGPWRHEERGVDGSTLSFFCDDCVHVVTRSKEATIARPHGHILRSGDSLWLEPDQFGITCYAAGVFGAQAYFGNTNLARLLSVVRNALNVARASGQRVFVRRDGPWRQLGIPSAWEVRPNEVRWLYRTDGDTLITARARCSKEQAVSCLELSVLSGPPHEFLVTHQLALGANEFDHAGELEVHPAQGWISCRPAADTLVASAMPGTRFAIAAARTEDVVALSGDALLYADGIERGGPYAAIHLAAGKTCGVILAAGRGDDLVLDAVVQTARETFACNIDKPRARAECYGGVPRSPVRLAGGNPGVARIDDVLPWFTHNAWIHFSAPHGLEQAGGAAWGVRDVCQGSIEWLLTAGELGVVRRMLETVFARQFPDGSWPQWFMHEPFRWIQSAHSHGDVCFWPVKALCDYLEASADWSLLKWKCRYATPERADPISPEETLLQHCERVVDHVATRFVPGTALVNYGDGDWDDTLQPADPAMRTRMVSAWTVGLAFHTFRQLAEVCRRSGATRLADHLRSLLGRMRGDFVNRLMPDGIAAGFLVREDAGDRVLLHPRDQVTGIRYRLLPMTRSVLAELFTPEEAKRHLRIVKDELLYPDGARLMSEPARYHGGLERLFKRGDTAANVGREIGLQYVHAHLRYAEALAKVGDAEGLWHALQVVNPVGLGEVVPHAAPRQANVYFSSSDADFPNRIEAAEHWSKLRTGAVAVRGGWRLYSSGPGLFLHKVRTSLLGIRESWGDVVVDPVLPKSLDGLVADVRLAGVPVRLHYAVGERSFSPSAIRINGTPMDNFTREANPYRPGGLRLDGDTLRALLKPTDNRIEVVL